MKKFTLYSALFISILMLSSLSAATDQQQKSNNAKLIKSLDKELSQSSTEKVLHEQKALLDKELLSEARKAQIKELFDKALTFLFEGKHKYATIGGFASLVLFVSYLIIIQKTEWGKKIDMATPLAKKTKSLFTKVKDQISTTGEAGDSRFAKIKESAKTIATNKKVIIPTTVLLTATVISAIAWRIYKKTIKANNAAAANVNNEKSKDAKKPNLTQLIAEYFAKNNDDIVNQVKSAEEILSVIPAEIMEEIYKASIVDTKTA